jgi:hypothetical protein
MPNSVDAIVAQVQSLYQAGRAVDAVPILKAALLSEHKTPADCRRLNSILGGMLNDLGRWSEAEQVLITAKALANDLGDPVGYWAAHSNHISSHFLRWQYRRVLELTESAHLPAADSPAMAHNRSTLLVNRASAAISLRMGSAGIAAATEALDVSALTGAAISEVNVAIAVHMLVRGRLFARDVVGARRDLERFATKGLEQPRVRMHLNLAHAAVAVAEKNTPDAYRLIDGILASTVPLPVRRDALSIKLALLQSEHDAPGCIEVLHELARYTIDHRKAVLTDALSMAQEAAPALHNLAGSGPTAVPSKTLVGRMIDIARASESAESFERRQAVAVLASLFASHIGYGHQFCRELERAAMIRDFGGFVQTKALGSVVIQGVDLRQIEIHATTRILEELGFAGHDMSYGLVEQQHERVDGAGPMRVRGADFKRANQALAICLAYWDSLAAANFAPELHRSFIIRTAQLSGRWFSAEITREFHVFADELVSRTATKQPVTNVRDALLAAVSAHIEMTEAQHLLLPTRPADLTQS